MAKKLYYAGTVIQVDDSVQRTDIRATQGAITVKTAIGGSITLATGPGIALALEELPVRDLDEMEPVTFV